MKVFCLLITLFLTSITFSQDFNINSNSFHSGGSFLVFRSSTIDSIELNQIRKPVIWIEGFEVTQNLGLVENYNLLNQNI